MIAQDERVTGVIPAAKIKTGMFSTKAYTLVVTDRRLLLAEMTDAAVKRHVEEARAEKKAEGGGFLGQWGAQLGAALRFADRYLAMSPEVILAETPGNAALTPAELRSIKVERKKDRGGDDEPDRDYLRITIEAGSGKREFNTDGEHPKVDQARALLAATFGAIVR